MLPSLGSQLCIASRDHHSRNLNISKSFWNVCQQGIRLSGSQPWPAPARPDYFILITWQGRGAGPALIGHWGSDSAPDWLSRDTVTGQAQPQPTPTQSPFTWPWLPSPAVCCLAVTGIFQQRKCLFFAFYYFLMARQICDPSLGPVLHFIFAHDPGKWRQVEKCEGLDESRDPSGRVRRPGLIKPAAEERSVSLSHCKALSEVVSDQIRTIENVATRRHFGILTNFQT